MMIQTRGQPRLDGFLTTLIVYQIQQRSRNRGKLCKFVLVGWWRCNMFYIGISNSHPLQTYVGQKEHNFHKNGWHSWYAATQQIVPALNSRACIYKSNMDDQLPVRWSSDLAACHVFSTCFMLYRQGMVLRDTKTNGFSRSMDTFCFDVHWKGSKVRNQCWYFSILWHTILLHSFGHTAFLDVSGIFIGWLFIESSSSIWTLTRKLKQSIIKMYNDCIIWLYVNCLYIVFWQGDKEWFSGSMSNARCGYPINSWLRSCSASQSRTVLCCLLCTSAGQRWNRRLIGTLCLWARQTHDAHHYINTPDIFMHQHASNMPWSTIPQNMSPALCLSMCVTSLQRASLKQQNEWVSEGCTSKFNSPGECQMTLDLLVTSHKGLLQTSNENKLQKQVFCHLKEMGPCKKDYFR